jgi:hypothetical protein
MEFWVFLQVRSPEKPSDRITDKQMILLFCLAVALLSFTRIPMWLQVSLLFVPTVAVAMLTHDAMPIKVTTLALIGALVLYMPLVFVASFILTGGIRVAFRRLRFLYFVFAIVVFALLVMNLTQLIGIV